MSNKNTRTNKSTVANKASRAKVNTPAPRRTVNFLSPKGKNYAVTNLSAFAKRFNLDSSSLSKVINGARKHYKNWTVQSVTA